MFLTLQRVGIFKIADTGTPSDYSIKVSLLNQSQPFAGLDMEVTLLVRYVLTDNNEQKEIWAKDIISTYTATMGEAFVGMVRLRKANEGAVRENLLLLLQELSALNL